MSKLIYDYVLKFIIVGDSTVGKSNIMSKYTDKRFQTNHDMTIGVEFATKIISVGNTNYKLQIWDTAGQETFKAITRSYYRGTIGCLLVYDITRRESFEAVSMWLSELRNFCDPNTVIALVGNKIDLENTIALTNPSNYNNINNINSVLPQINNILPKVNSVLPMVNRQRVVSYEEGKTFAEQNNLLFFETSAKTGQNIEYCFTQIVQNIQKKIESNEITLLPNSGLSIKLIPTTPNNQSSYGCSC